MFPYLAGLLNVFQRETDGAARVFGQFVSSRHGLVAGSACLIRIGLESDPERYLSG